MEDEIREEFIKRAPVLCEKVPIGSEQRVEWEWYFMMQHFGTATRLLDWTEGALIALYFAVRSNDGSDDAAVWVLDPYQLNKRVIGKEWIIPPSAVGGYKKGSKPNFQVVTRKIYKDARYSKESSCNRTDTCCKQSQLPAFVFHHSRARPTVARTISGWEKQLSRKNRHSGFQSK